MPGVVLAIELIGDSEGIAIESQDPHLPMNCSFDGVIWVEINDYEGEVLPIPL
jgi:hypothetical protein